MSASKKSEGKKTTAGKKFPVKIIFVIVAAIVVLGIISFLISSYGGAGRSKSLITEGNALMKQKKYEDAAKKFYEAMKVYPKGEEAYLLLAGALIADKRTGEAYTILTQAKEKFPKSYKVNVELATFYLLNAQNENALKELEEAWNKNKKDPLIKFLMGQAYLNDGRLDEAYSQFKEVTAFNAGSEKNREAIDAAYLSLLEIIGNEGRMDQESLSIMTNAIKHFPEDKQGPAFIALGIYYYNQGDWDGALKRLLIALKKSPDENAWANLPVAEIYLKKGDKAKALEYYKNFLNKYSDPGKVTGKQAVGINIYGGARAFGNPRLNTYDITDWSNLMGLLKNHSEPDDRRVWDFLSNAAKETIVKWKYGSKVDENTRLTVTDGFNEVLASRDFYKPDKFKNIKLTPQAQELYKKGTGNLSTEDLQRFNRIVLESVYKGNISSLQMNNPYIIDYVKGKVKSLEG